MIDLGRNLQSPQGHAKQEPHPGHDAVAVTDARADLGKMQLKLADVLARCRLRRSLEKRGKSPAACDMAPLRFRAEFARVHVVDHALAQWSDSIIGSHRQLLS